MLLGFCAGAALLCLLLSVCGYFLRPLFLKAKKWRQQCIKLPTGSFFWGGEAQYWCRNSGLSSPHLLFKISNSEWYIPYFFLGPVVVQELWAIQPSSPLQNFQFWLSHSLFFGGPVVVQELWAIHPSSPLQNFQFWVVHSLFFLGPSSCAGTLGYPALISSSKFPVLTGTFPIFFSAQ